MVPQIYIFIGQSGSGKGTQALMLEKKLQEIDPEHGVLYLETGKHFRDLIETIGYTAKKTKAVMEEGKLPPPFLGIHAWTHVLIKEYDGQSHVIIDGTPRVAAEVPILITAAEFYGWHPHVVFIDVSDEWASDKMEHRGRGDDRDENDIWGRIQWYHESVVPTIELLRQSSLVDFHTIKGEQSIEAVHDDICKEFAIGIQ
jgi:adenylate kinase family enzyme